MGQYWLNVALIRVVLPVALGGCTIWRPTGLSLVYFILLLYLPMVPIPTYKTMNGHTGRYLRASICLSFLVSLTQLTFHIVLLSLPPYGHFLQKCEFLERLFRHVGLVRLDSASVWEAFFWLFPEIIVPIVTVIVYCICRRLTHEAIVENDDDDDNSSMHRSAKKAEESSSKIINFLGTIGTYVVLASLCCTAALNPSIEGSFYFLVFLGAATWWACHRELRKGFAVICRIVMIVVVVHVLLLLIYQNQWPQELMPTKSTWARYFAMTTIYQINCTNPRYVDYIYDAHWTTYGYSSRLIWLYYVLALQSQFLSRKPAKEVTRLSGKLENLDTPLSRHVSIKRRTPSQRWQSARRKARKLPKSPSMPVDEKTPLMRFGSGRAGLLQDSTGSVIVQDGHHEDSIQMQSFSDGVPEDKPGVVEHVIMAVYSVFQLVVRSSYLATNIIMMTWSIMYHSWTTFALLLWALILWMVPNKRASMMNCSPFIVLYATLLLLGQYVYSMNLTEEEVPTLIHGIKMSEIGFSKPDQLGEWHMIVKCLFMTMFWITMRQHMAERKQRRRSSALRDMVAPLHVSVSTATTAMNQDAPEIKSKFMKDVGTLVKKLLTKFWIAVVAIMLFTSGITGERMTVFRIIYMSLFLVFVITFQISWLAWRRMMYGFWITVIGYSVIMLILVYTYQFHNFPTYWEYIYIDKDLQMDIGLETYETKDLFVRLLTPTFFVIITVLQIHYFHQDFLEVTNIEKLEVIGNAKRESLGRSPSLLPIVSPADVSLTHETHQKSTMYTLKQLKRMSKLERLALYQRILNHLVNFYNYIWLFLELHMQKIVFISLVLLSVNDVCAIHFVFILTVVIAINLKRSVQIMAINAMAAIIALLMVTKMLYQIEYIDHSNWNVNCTRNPEDGANSSISTIYNIAEWIGMKKAEPSKLPDLLKGYIGIVTVTTLRAIIIVRQCFFRYRKGEPLDTPQIMFSNITRADADKGIPECLKFLFNYGFYKFGLEFCLMGTVALIGTRLDFYSVLYAIWLGILFSLSRKAISKVWPFFRFFAVVLLPAQYLLVVAPPTWFCIEYPWNESRMLRKLQEWMYFPDPDSPPNPRKLICDFILLLMIVRQSLVFRIERRNDTTHTEFAAGHNYSVFLDMDKPNFVNPVKDFVSHIHSWLDVLKRGCMMSLMWVTLSIMFLAGTKRTNLFSLGYLIGAFAFLWQGSDFYLRPMRSILKWWNVLIGYNIVVILSKALLQGVGCVLIKELEHSACWLIQLLGIACLTKFKSSITLSIEDIECQVPREDIGMVWDGLCFGFLLMQKRLFKSYYFFHIVDETKAMSILASRGAELLEELHQKRIEYQETVEKNILQKLKFKMDKIKANQQKIQGPSYREPETHKIDSIYPASRPLYRHRTPKTNREAIRSGDYYMFDDLDDDDVTELLTETEEKEERIRRQRQEERGRRMTVSELMTALIKTDIEIATHVALYGGTKKDALRLRRRSVPMTRKKSSMSYLSARSETDTAAATDARDPTSLDSEVVDDVEREAKTEESTKFPERSDDEEEEEEEEEEKKTISLLTYFKFVWAIVNSTMVSMTKYLNQYSRDYRYIRKVLAKEKKSLKAKPDFRMGMRLGINQIWQPIPLLKQRSTTDGSTDEPVDEGEGTSQIRNQDERKESSLTVPHIRILAPSLERGLDMSSSSSIFSQPQQEEQEQAELSEVDQPPMIQLAASIWFGILAHSTLLCYFMVFLHQIKNASVLSIPLPLMVFLWGSLTIPRPSKTFWVTLIAYTEVIVIVKCMFQLELVPWNQSASPNHPLFAPRIIGVERKSNYALWDLLLLLMVFFHRFMLKSLGQWTTPSLKPRKIIPSKLTMATSGSTPPTKGQGEQMPKFSLQNENESKSNVDVVTPRGRSISLLRTTDGDAEIQNGVTDENERLVAVQAEEIDPCNEKFTRAMSMTILKYLEPVRTFFENILSSSGKEKTNVYAYMFLCDFFNFLLLIFGFSSFGTQQGDGGVTAYLAENRVPMPFLLMLLLQFALIVIDRALFLRKSILGKLVFQYFLVLGVHIWMFFILPSVTERQFNDKLPPQIWYMVKCFYLLLAAYQLRLGYPTRILGNFLCKKYNVINYVLFKGFMLIPFLFELRAVMDWIWTDTSMTIMDWFKMEDIFASIYQIKCMRGVESDFPQPRGIKKKQSSKYLVGGGMLFVIIGLIWFPLLLFALGGTVGVSNLPYEVSLQIKIGSYEPIYSMVAQNFSIFRYTKSDYRNLTNLYARDRSAITFLENYINTDVAAVRLSGSSRKFWSISPPDRARLMTELESNNIMTVHVEWTVSRKTDAKDTSGITPMKREIHIPPYVQGEFNPMRKSLENMLYGNRTNSTDNTIHLLNAFPKFLKVTNRITAVVPQLMRSLLLPRPPDDDDDDDDDERDKDYLYRNISLKLSSNPDCCAQQQWWIVEEHCDDPIYNILLRNIPLNNCKYIMMFLFNDKAFPEELSFISGFGILGLYTTGVIVASQLIRKMVCEMAPKIMFEDLPYVDRILRLCLDIYLVRESGELCLEEDLFAKLIFLYRSPETLIRWTRPPDPGEEADNNDDGDDNDEDDDRTERREERESMRDA